MRYGRHKKTPIVALALTFASGALVLGVGASDGSAAVCVRASNTGIAPGGLRSGGTETAVDAPVRAASREDREQALREARAAAENLARSSLARARSARLTDVRVSVSFLRAVPVANALQLADQANLDLDSIAWGFAVPEAYNIGEIDARNNDGSKRNLAELRGDFVAFVSLREFAIRSRPPDGNPFVQEELAALSWAREHLPVIGIRGRSTLNSVSPSATDNPSYIWAVNDPSCGNPLLVPPEEAVRVPPDRPRPGADLAPPKGTP